MHFSILLWRIGLGCWLISLALAARAQSSRPDFDLVQRVGQQLSSPVGGPAVTSMVADNWGNVYVAGYFTGTVQLGSTVLTTGTAPNWATRSFLAKLDATGAYQWAVDVDGVAPTSPNRLLAVDAAGNVYLAGGYTGSSATFGSFQLTGSPNANNLFVLKLTADGAFIWARQAPGSDAGVNGLAVDLAGNVYLTGGYTNATATFGSLTLTNAKPGHCNTFVAKLTATGRWQWAAQSVAGSFASEPDFVQCIAADYAGNVYVGGYFGASTLTLGKTTLTNNNAYGWTGDGFVARLDTAGQWVWGHRLGNAGYDGVRDLAVDTNGDVVLTGYLQGPVDADSWLQPSVTNGNYEAFVARLAATGAVRWATGAGGPEVDLPYQLALDVAGNAYITGYFTSAVATFGNVSATNPHGPRDEEAFVAKINPSGGWQWAQQTLGNYYSRGHGLTADPSGTVWLFGTCEGTSTAFSGLTLPLQSRFVARIGSAAYATVVGSVRPGSGSPGQTVTVTGAHFTGTTGVYFNGVPASSFTVLSQSKLEAVVPPGATTGRVEVRTAAGGNGAAPVFQVSGALAAGAAQGPAPVQAWPIPLGAERRLHVRLPAPLLAGQPSQATVYSALGSVVARLALTTTETELPLLTLPAGLYVLTVQTAGQPLLTKPLVVE